jgi:putative addiction module component (TIGR02574 family)
MPMTLSQIEHEVDLLPQKEQMVLFSHLQERLAPPQEELDRIWGEEAIKRYASYKAGTSKAYPADEVTAALKSELTSRDK